MEYTKYVAGGAKMTKEEIVEYIFSFEDVKNPGFDTEVVGEALGCTYSDKRISMGSSFDFCSVPERKLEKICEYIKAAVLANRLAGLLDEEFCCCGCELETELEIRNGECSSCSVRGWERTEMREAALVEREVNRYRTESEVCPDCLGRGAAYGCHGCGSDNGTGE